MAPLSLLISYIMTPNVNMLLLIRKRFLILNLMLLHRKNQKSKKSVWVRKIFEERTKNGEVHLLVRDLRLLDHQYFFRYFRMSPSTFEQHLLFIAPVIIKETTVMRGLIGPAERFAAKLLFLVTGDAQSNIVSSYRISPTSVSRIIS